MSLRNRLLALVENPKTFVQLKTALNEPTRRITNALQKLRLDREVVKTAEKEWVCTCRAKSRYPSDDPYICMFPLGHTGKHSFEP